ncbi:MAG TPA: EF-hand domain-containing protein [Gemmataceae bacterium]|nr:EF-hand domain-containing protein [Gemmataceae bacterium]
MRSALLTAPAGVLLAWLGLAAGPADTGKPAPVAGDEIDVVYLHASRPVLLRLHVQIDGRAHGAAWEEAMRGLFRFLDHDGDGALSQKELAHAPSPAQLLGMFRDGAPEPGPAPKFEDVDAGPRDGKVTPEEFLAFYRRAGARPVQVERGQRQGGADPLTDALFRLLDRDRDGKLSRDELLAAPAALQNLDVDDDEMVSAGEVLNRLGGGPFTFRASPGAGAEWNGFPFWPVRAGAPAEPLARQLLARYDRDSDGRLSRAESGLGADAFNRLDADRDGRLSAAELAGFPRLPPDVELIVRRGRKTPAPAHVLVISPKAKGSALTAAVGPSGAEAYVTLADSRLEVLCDGRPLLPVADRREEYRRFFRGADGNRDGFLDGKEVYRPPFAFVALLRLADRDGDGRLSEKEVVDYLDVQARAARQVTVLTLVERGPSLFEMLDADHDGRLSRHELRTAWARLARWDRDGDGAISRKELPRLLHAVVSHGQATLAEREPDALGYGPAARRRAPARGPLWFRRMDRNGDGMISPREWLGDPQEFRRLDADGDGLLSPEEAERADRESRPRGKP